MMTLPAKTRPKVALIVAVAVAAGLFLARLWVLDPVYKRRHLLSERVSAETSKLELLQRIIGLEKDLTAFKDAIPPRREISWLIEEINRTAADAGVTLTTVAPLGEDKTQDHWRSSLRVEAQADYHAFGAWIARIESAPVFLKVTSARLETTPQSRREESTGPIAAVLVVSFYYPIKETP